MSEQFENSRKYLMRQTDRRTVENSLDVWSFLTQCYGFYFVDNYGTFPSKVWIDVIKELSDEEIERGKNSVITSGSTYVPRLPQFYAYCKGITPNSEESKASDIQIQKLMLVIVELERKIDLLISGGAA